MCLLGKLNDEASNCRTVGEYPEDDEYFPADFNYNNLNNNTVNDQESPCPRLFFYEPSGDEVDRWYGVVTLISDIDLNGVWLRLIFNKPSLRLEVMHLWILIKFFFYFGSRRIGLARLLLKTTENTSSRIGILSSQRIHSTP